MSKAESLVVGIVVGTICPLLTFVAFWWTAAAVCTGLAGVSINVVIGAALTGLVLGVCLDLVFLRRWARAFYTANLWLMAIVYVGLSVVAVAFLMGLPVGTFALGIGAGAYAGRRQRHLAPDGSSLVRASRKAALFAAFVTAGGALPIGLLALDERNVSGFLGALPGLEHAGPHKAGSLILVGFLAVLLFIAQYWCSKKAGQIMFRVGRGRVRQVAPANGGSRQSNHGCRATMP
jgi:hypothetical protein